MAINRHITTALLAMIMLGAASGTVRAEDKFKIVRLSPDNNCVVMSAQLSPITGRHETLATDIPFKSTFVLIKQYLDNKTCSKVKFSHT